MSKKTIYGCDRCGKESENERNFFEITIRLYGGRSPQDRLVCKECAGQLAQEFVEEPMPRAPGGGEGS